MLWMMRILLGKVMVGVREWKMHKATFAGGIFVTRGGRVTRWSRLQGPRFFTWTRTSVGCRRGRVLARFVILRDYFVYCHIWNVRHASQRLRVFFWGYLEELI
jgi:hypothetical protein